MSPRTRFLIVLVVAVVAVDLVVRAASPMLPKPLQWYSTFADTKADQLDAMADGPDPDVVFIGSSAVATSLDPATFTASDPCHRTAYNAALTGATPKVNERWLHDAVLPNVQPKMVVLGFASRDLRDDPELAQYENQLATRTDALADIDKSLSDVSALVKYRSVLREPQRWFANAVEDAPQLNADGFDRSRGKDKYQLGSYTKGSLGGYTIDAATIDALERIIDDLRGRGIEPVVADMAVSKDYANAHKEGAPAVEAYRAALRKVAQDKGVRFVELGSTLPDTSLFSDPIHTNQAGSAAETKALAEELGRDGCGKA